MHRLILEKDENIMQFKKAIVVNEPCTDHEFSGTTVTISDIDQGVLNQLTINKVSEHLREKF